MNGLRILWCIQSLPVNGQAMGYGGGGWIASLFHQLANMQGVILGVASYGNNKCLKKEGHIPLYFISSTRLTTKEKFLALRGNFLGWLRQENEHMEALNDIIEDFKPHVIHVWGTETDFGLIAKRTQVPVVLHLQGLHNPICNALLPPGFSKFDFIKSNGLTPIKMLFNYRSLCYWKYKCNREIRIFQSCRNYFGRTSFDFRVCKLFSPLSKYYYCGEVLRSEFMDNTKTWELHKGSVIKLVSIISSPFYKGLDLILKTALILKSSTNIKFNWNVVGLNSAPYVESKTGIRASDCNVTYCGIKTAEEICDIDLSSDIYVHPSYIDNSPNSVCEAQLLGLPVIATNVGGVSSIVKDGESGILVPANDPYQMAFCISELLSNPQMMEKISKNSINIARQRHSASKIVEDVLSAYRQLNTQTH